MEIVIPFVENLRANNVNDDAFMVENDVVDKDDFSGYAVFKMDSEISYLNYLR